MNFIANCSETIYSVNLVVNCTEKALTHERNIEFTTKFTKQFVGVVHDKVHELVSS